MEIGNTARELVHQRRARVACRPGFFLPVTVLSQMFQGYEYPSGAGTAVFYIRGDFVYSIGGEAAYCICGDYWYPYPPCPSRPAFWVSGKYVYEYLSLATPKYCMT